MKLKECQSTDCSPRNEGRGRVLVAGDTVKAEISGGGGGARARARSPGGPFRDEKWQRGALSLLFIRGGRGETRGARSRGSGGGGYARLMRRGRARSKEGRGSGLWPRGKIEGSRGELLCVRLQGRRRHCA